ncbi:hypothetical protein EEL36_01115 [Muribaculaceae bacterium Isolate-043 (Harlan)]|nr:hypothetical protein EEL36_01115 [Muribaculaceae bacterium Isolate-043 (Harlan)]
MAFLLTIFNSSGGFVQKKLQLIFVKPRAEGERADQGVVGDHPQAAGARGWGQGRYVRAGGLSWRGRLISQAPQLGRTGGTLLSPGLRGTLLPPPR